MTNTYQTIKLIVHDVDNNKNNNKEKEKTETIELIFKLNPIIENNKTIFNPLDITGRFHEYTAREYNKLFNKLFIPSIHMDVFIISKEDFNKGVFTIHAWKTTNRKTSTTTFTHGDYTYTYNPLYNIFSVKYVGNKDVDEIKTYPFPSFNGIDIDYNGLYKGCKIKRFDMSKLVLDCCVDISNMFKNCEYLKNVNFIIQQNRIQNMKGLFNGCRSLTKLDMSNCIYMMLTSDNISKCFNYCQSLTDINIDKILIKGNFNKNTSMFTGCKRLVNIICNPRVYDKIKSTLPCYEYWIPTNNKHLTPLRKIELVVNNNNTSVCYRNTYNDVITVVNIKDDKYKVLYYDDEDVNNLLDNVLDNI